MNLIGARRLIVGLGSPHGDDQLGWEVVTQLRALLCDDPQTTLRVARDPSELLDWLAGIDELHVCDACVSGAEIGTVGRWDWPAFPQSVSLPATSSHALPLLEVLNLAERLGQLPTLVTIWGLEGRPFGPGTAISPAGFEAARRLATQLASAPAHA